MQIKVVSYTTYNTPFVSKLPNYIEQHISNNLPTYYIFMINNALLLFFVYLTSLVTLYLLMNPLGQFNILSLIYNERKLDIFSMKYFFNPMLLFITLIWPITHLTLLPVSTDCSIDLTTIVHQIFSWCHFSCPDTSALWVVKIIYYWPTPYQIFLAFLPEVTLGIMILHLLILMAIQLVYNVAPKLVAITSWRAVRKSPYLIAVTPLFVSPDMQVSMTTPSVHPILFILAFMPEIAQLFAFQYVASAIMESSSIPLHKRGVLSWKRAEYSLPLINFLYVIFFIVNLSIGNPMDIPIILFLVKWHVVHFFSCILSAYSPPSEEELTEMNWPAYPRRILIVVCFLTFSLNANSVEFSAFSALFIFLVSIWFHALSRKGYLPY